MRNTHSSVTTTKAPPSSGGLTALTACHGLNSGDDCCLQITVHDYAVPLASPREVRQLIQLRPYRTGPSEDYMPTVPVQYCLHKRASEYMYRYT